jgi:predicted transcriptional regulator
MVGRGSLDRTPTNVLRDVNELEQFGILELKKSRREGRQQEILRPEFNWDGFEVQITPQNVPKKKRAA